MSSIGFGTPTQGGWYAQQNPDGEQPESGVAEAEKAARHEWADTHPNVFRRVLARLHRT